MESNFQRCECSKVQTPFSVLSGHNGRLKLGTGTEYDQPSYAIDYALFMHSHFVQST